MFGKQKIIRHYQKSLTHHLLVLFLCIALLPLITLSIFEYQDAKKALTESRYKHISTINLMLGQEVETHYNTIFDDLNVNADDAKRFITQLKKLQQVSGQTMQQYLVAPGYHQQWIKYSDFFHKALKHYYSELFMTDSAGTVLFSMKTPNLTGESLSEKSPPLGRVLSQAFLQKKAQFSTIYSPLFLDTSIAEQQSTNKKQTHFFMLPLFSEKQDTVGALIIGTDEQPFFKTDHELETHIVSWLVDKNMEVRFTTLQKMDFGTQINTIATEDLSDNPLVKAWQGNQYSLRSKETPVQYTNSNNVTVLGVAQSLDISETPMLLITEIPVSEVFLTINKFKNYVAILLLSMIIVVILASVFFAFYISEPLKKLTGQMKQVMQGHYIHVTPLPQQNEIGELSRTFAAMTVRLKETSEENSHQLWQQQGLIEFNDQLRSEITPEALAQSVLNWLCHYIHAAGGEIWFCKAALSYGTEQTLLASIIKEADTLPYGGYNLRFSLIFRRQVVGRLVLKNNNAFTASQKNLVALIPDPLTVSLCTMCMYQQLQKGSEHKSEFLATMSHELRSPLHSILILSQVLEENSDGNLSPEQQQSAATIHRVGQQLLHLVNDILDLSKVEAGQLKVIKETFPLLSVIEPLTVQFDLKAKEKNINFSVINRVDCQTLYTDSHRLLQILQNLLSNAVKFTDNGNITLTIDKQFNQLAFSVTDTGIGISEEKQVLIFQPFHQADNSDSRRYDGTGLGLTISQKLATLLGGNIQIQSKLGEGSTFVLTVPYQKTAEEQITKKSDQMNTFTLSTYSHNKLITDTSVNEQYKAQVSGVSVMLIMHDLRQIFYLSSLLEPLNIRVKLINQKSAVKEKLMAQPKTDIILVEEALFHFVKDIVSESLFRNIPVILFSSVPNDAQKVFPVSVKQAVSVPCSLNKLLGTIINCLPHKGHSIKAV